MIILIIDDVDSNLMIFSAFAKSIENTKSYTFNNPVEAFEWCKKNTPDLIIVDYMMPDLNGIEFSRKFRELTDNQPIPIIMITAYNEREIRLEALNAGINDFLGKPVDKVEFQARVKNMLMLRDAQKKVMDKAQWLAEEVKKATKKIDDRENEIIIRLSKAAEFRDDDTGQHIIRMAHYSFHIAQNLGLPEAECNMILKAAPMHGVGIVALPDNILLKPGRLTKEEFDIIKTHTTSGYDILADSDIELLNFSAIIAITHHEKFNGKGYPKGLNGEDIPLVGRICAVADVFDALTSERPYKNAWPVEKALELIKSESGEHFDPKCVDAFLTGFENILKIKNKYNN
jgi:putative two-component system response regulator